MAGSGAESPEWLRTFQAPDRSTFSISSDSGSHSSLKISPGVECGFQSLSRGTIYDPDDDDLTVLENDGMKLNVNCHANSSLGGRDADAYDSSKKRMTIIEDDVISEEKESGEEASMDQSEIDRSASMMSSDSDYFPDSDLKGVKKMSDKKGSADKQISDDKKSFSSPKISSKTGPIQKSSNGLICEKGENVIETETADRDHADAAGEKLSSCRVSTTLPLVFSDKVHRSKALVECEGDSIDLSGDMGAVGRVVISDGASQGNELQFDLKGTIYNTCVIPCKTFCVVSFGQSEAKIEAIMTDFIQLKPESNVFDAETMVEGTLEGFSFESDDEADKCPKPPNQPEQDDNNEEKTNKKRKGRPGKSSGAAQTKTTAAKSRLPKKQKKKPQMSKKSKIKK